MEMPVRNFWLESGNPCGAAVRGVWYSGEFSGDLPNVPLEGRGSLILEFAIQSEYLNVCKISA